MPIYPYVYRLDHPTTGEFYIGYNAGKGKLGVNYFTSSKTVKPRFHEFEITKIIYFEDVDEAYIHEQYLIWVDWHTPGRMNKVCRHGAKAKFGMTGTKHSDVTKAKMRESAKNRPPSTLEQNKANSERQRGVPKGPRGPLSEETKNNISAAKKAWWAKKKLAAMNLL